MGWFKDRSPLWANHKKEEDDMLTSLAPYAADPASTALIEPLPFMLARKSTNSTPSPESESSREAGQGDGRQSRVHHDGAVESPGLPHSWDERRSQKQSDHSPIDGLALQTAVSSCGPLSLFPSLVGQQHEDVFDFPRFPRPPSAPETKTTVTMEAGSLPRNGALTSSQASASAGKLVDKSTPRHDAKRPRVARRVKTYGDLHTAQFNLPSGADMSRESPPVGSATTPRQLRAPGPPPDSALPALPKAIPLATPKSQKARGKPRKLAKAEPFDTPQTSPDDGVTSSGDGREMLASSRTKPLPPSPKTPEPKLPELDLLAKLTQSIVELCSKVQALDDKVSSVLP